MAGAAVTEAVVPTVPATATIEGENTLKLINQQSARSINSRFLRQVTRTFLDQAFPGVAYHLCFTLVSPEEMTSLNETFLQHGGSTDVITFDYGAESGESGKGAVRAAGAPQVLHGEVFISVADAVAHARRYGTSWQSEVIRYVIHAILHLAGYDDLDPAARRTMKRRERHWLGQLAKWFTFRHLGQTPRERKPGTR